MGANALTIAAAWGVAIWLGATALGATSTVAHAAPPDPRLKEVRYDPHAVVTIFVKRGVVTDVVLDADEAITDVGSGLGADCAKPEAAWCIAAQPGGRHIFVKPKSTAEAPNNLAVVTNRRSHSLRFVVLDDQDRREPVYRVSISAASPAARAASTPGGTAALPPLPDLSMPKLADFVAERLAAAPVPVNWNYALAEGKGSDDIVPTLVFDDGRFTYLKFPNNREVPAAFHVLPDGTETLLNTRMEGELLVVDRVSRRLVLRSGSAVVGIWNEAFDLDGAPPHGGTTVPGVERVVKAEAGAAAVPTTAPATGASR
ncbi:MAG: TrbG/VirB9 family P-type conjugative transfer protein [Burkholderiaceae bacterium]